MKTILILLLLAAPASAAWDLNNLTPSQRSSLITMRNRWNNGFRGTPRCKTGCEAGVIRHQWYDGKVKDAKPVGSLRAPANSYNGGPETILNPYVKSNEINRDRGTTHLYESWSGKHTTVRPRYRRVPTSALVQPWPETD